MEFKKSTWHDKIVFYVMYGFRERGFIRDKQVCGVDVQIFHFVDRFPGLRAKRGNSVNLITQNSP